MATYTVNVAKHATLTPNTVDTITFNAPASFILITNRTTSGATMFFTFGDPTIGIDDPTVSGDDSYAVGIGQTLSIPADGSAPIVKIVSAQAQAYSVQTV